MHTICGSYTQKVLYTNSLSGRYNLVRQSLYYWIPITVNNIFRENNTVYCLHQLSLQNISINDKKYTLCVMKSLEQLKKLKKWPLVLLRPKTNYTCHQKLNPSRETVPLSTSFTKKACDHCHEEGPPTPNPTHGCVGTKRRTITL
jgi:hypothetical protein